MCTDHEHAAEAALLLSLATADDAAPDADESHRVVCRDEAAQRLLHDALLDVLIQAAAVEATMVEARAAVLTVEGVPS